MKRIRLTQPSLSVPDSSSSTRILTFELTMSSSSPPQTLKYEIENAFFNNNNKNPSSDDADDEIEVIKLKHDPIHFPVTAALLDRFANFLTSISKKNYLQTLIRLSSPEQNNNNNGNSSLLPRIAWSSGLAETIGKENWKALLSIFDQPDYFEKTFIMNSNNNNSKTSSLSPPLQNGIAILSICREDCLNLHSSICDLLLWEISRRLRMCSDSKEVESEFYGSNNSSSDQQQQQQQQGANEEAKEELRELVAPQIFEVGTARKSATAELLSKEEDEQEEDYLNKK